MFTLVASLLLTPAFAANTIDATVVPGVTARKVAEAMAPVPVLTFRHQKVEWTISCMGADAKLSCRATAGERTAPIKTATATSVVLQLGGGDWEVRSSGSPIGFNALSTNENITSK